MSLPQDLKSFLEAEREESDEGDANLSAQARRIKQGGFGSVSTRRLSKPIIAAVDGPAMGGGTELVLNSDLVLATTRSIFALPEVARGVVAAMGGITRVSDVAGHQRACEMLLCGRAMSAQDAYTRFQFVNALVPVEASQSVEAGQAAIEAEALKWAARIVSNSPDAVLVTKEALNMARDAGKGADGIDDASLRSFDGQRSKALYDGDNIREGLTAFFEVRSRRRGTECMRALFLGSHLAPARRNGHQSGLTRPSLPRPSCRRPPVCCHGANVCAHLHPRSRHGPRSETSARPHPPHARTFCCADARPKAPDDVGAGRDEADDGRLVQRPGSRTTVGRYNCSGNGQSGPLMAVLVGAGVGTARYPSHAVLIEP